MRCAVAIVLVLLVAPSTSAQQPRTDNRNASTWYNKAIEQYQALPQAQRDLLLDYEPESGPPSPEVRAALANVQVMLGHLKRGSMQEYSDYGLDYGQGIELTLPHLAPLRGIARIARADVMARLADHDSAGAAERLASLYRMSAHSSDDRLLISSLVGQAVFQLTDASVQSALDQAQLGASDAAVLLSAAKTLPPKDPFAYLEALAGEQEIFLADMKERLRDPERRAELLDADDPALEAVDEQDIDAAINQYDAVMTRTIEIFSMDDRAAAKAELDALNREVGLQQHGPLARLLIPAFTRIFEQRNKAEDMLAARVAVLEKLAGGQALPDEFANAALWYLRGIEMLANIEPAKLEAIRTFSLLDVEPADTRDPRPLNPDVAAALAAAGAVIDTFRDGSLKKRCDFSVARQKQPAALVPSYVPGMHDALALLRADALRLINQSDKNSSIDRLSICCRVIGHLGADPQLASALTAHHDFNRTMTVIEQALGGRVLADAAKPVLLSAAERISRKDPFGYLGALLQTRTAVAKRLAGAPEAADPQRPQRAAEAVKHFNGDQLLYLLAIFDTMERAAAQQAAPDAPPAVDPASRSSDILSMAALETARSEVTLIAPMLAQHDWNFFADRSIPQVAEGGVSDQMQRARADLRRAFTLLKPSE